MSEAEETREAATAREPAMDECEEMDFVHGGGITVQFYMSANSSIIALASS